VKVLAAAAVVLGAAGCASTFDDVDIRYNEAPPALSIAGPRAGADAGSLVYNAADDEDAVRPGIQLTLRVDVQDEGIERVDLALDAGDAQDDVVAEDLEGNRAAFFAVDVADDSVDHQVVARAVLPAVAAEVRAVLAAAVAPAAAP
jgi:hypothetical protein